MSDDMALPDLTFAGVSYGPSEAPWDLKVLLYKGAAGAHAGAVHEMILEGSFGPPMIERLPLVQRLHSEIRRAVIEGNARASIYQSIRMLRVFFSFVDSQEISIAGDAITSAYCAWADTLYMRTLPVRAQHKRRSSDGPLSARVAWTYAAQLGTLLDRSLERSTRLIQLTRLFWRPRRKSITGIETEKASLSDTLSFGNFIQDLCDGITLAKIKSEDGPVTVTLRTGQEVRWEPMRKHPQFEHFAWWLNIHAVNVRLEAELMMFLTQTGMNLAQALHLKIRQFSYQSYSDGYHVTDYKNRRGGSVRFDIFKDYRPHLERFLSWRRDLFRDSDLLFPFVGKPGTRQGSRFTGERLRTVCTKYGLRYVGPRKLRCSRVNWLLQASSNAEVTSDLAQHTTKTLWRDYHQPSYQRTIVETLKFWQTADPHQQPIHAVAPGACVGPLKDKRDGAAPSPDCVKPSGCLWCENHRDIDSFDHIWALQSFMYLKTVELSLHQVPYSSSEHNLPLQVVNLLQKKIETLMTSSPLRGSWVLEAQNRTAEGHYHPHFRSHIVEMEASDG